MASDDAGVGRSAPLHSLGEGGARGFLVFFAERVFLVMWARRRGGFGGYLAEGGMFRGMWHMLLPAKG